MTTPDDETCTQERGRLERAAIRRDLVRQYAGLAMQGLLANMGGSNEDDEVIAEWAVSQAETLLDELERRERQYVQARAIGPGWDEEQ